MKIETFPDGSFAYVYEIGDRVEVLTTIHKGWFDIGPTSAEHCTVVKIKTKGYVTKRLAPMEIKWSNEWGNVECFPWHVKPHPETLAKATPYINKEV